MGITERADSTSMDVDPRPASWDTLCPTFLDSRRIKMNLQDDPGHVIGSPPSAGPPKVLWNEKFPNARDDGVAHSNAVDTAELSSRVQDIRIRPQQPMIICETVEDLKSGTSDTAPCGTGSLSVPVIDISDEKKRPPMSPQ